MGGPFTLEEMQIDLLYFGILKDLLGCERDKLELPSGSRVEDVLRLLRARASNSLTAGQSGVWSALAVAVNREYAGASTELADGDELALLPPVSGGAGWHGEVRGEGRGANG